jgi:hypothetical protein
VQHIVSSPISTTGCDKEDPAQEVEYMTLPAEACQPTFEPTCQPAVSVKLNSTFADLT